MKAFDGMFHDPVVCSRSHLKVLHQGELGLIKGGKLMDEFAGFNLMVRQFHPQTGGGMMVFEVDNLAAVQTTLTPGPKGSVSRRQSPLVLDMWCLLSWREV